MISLLGSRVYLTARLAASLYRYVWSLHFSVTSSGGSSGVYPNIPIHRYREILAI